MTGLELAELMRRHRFRVQNEDELQQAIAIILDAEKVAFEREVVLSAIDRIDFLVGRIGIEVKVAGTAAKAMHQIQRYTCSDKLDEVVLVSTRYQAGRQPHIVNGKSIHVVFVSGGFI